MPWFNMSKETAKVVEFERELVECFKPYLDLRNQSVIDRADLRTIASKMVKNGWGKTAKRKREYFRYCPVCGEKYNQKDMIRMYDSSYDWVCQKCYEKDYGILNNNDEF